MSGGVLIVGEVVDGGLHPTVRQLVNAAGNVAGDVSDMTLCLAVDEAFDESCLEGRRCWRRWLCWSIQRR